MKNLIYGIVLLLIVAGLYRFSVSEIGNGIFLIIVSIIILFINKKIVKQNESVLTKEETKPMEEIINIPNTCPNCKNPNSKKIRICEWCGNETI